MLRLAVLRVLGKKQGEWQLKVFHHTKRIGEKGYGADKEQHLVRTTANCRRNQRSQGRLMKKHSSS